MDEALSLFDIEAAPADPSMPRCRMCARPALWLANQQRHAAYCAGASCNNRDRLCQSCGGPFVMGADGAGTKYCSTPCKTKGYMIRSRDDYIAPFKAVSCAWCGKVGERSPHRDASRHGIWPYICRDCTGPIKHVVQRLKTHRVSHERARALLTDPGCEVCGRNLLAKVRDPNTGHIRSALAVDHDHACCSGATSCGKCVRGLLCTQCNAAAGMLQDDPLIVEALATYLTKKKP